ncbi:amidohydrolase family protein [Synechococcus sp. CS-205]|uniref:amidohydrolase family protein n=1 Tax=Synechococcus sp. CS-205 TaxID=2847984 RepID=UPI00223BC2D1|nr:amidohydrolase family protein [Synechococcus sp. CS-205]MCT0248266.1 amidohydrolase family protein [Synechococcus sp. CS-205]
MVSAAGSLPPLLLPRGLIDPIFHHLPPADAGGLLAVRLRHQNGRITAIEAHPRAAGELLPLALTPLVEPHAHLDKAFSWERHPNLSGTMQGALAANQDEHQERSVEQVLERGERALERAWRHGLRAIRSHIDSLGPGAEPGWEGLLQLQGRWMSRLALQLVALVPVRHWGTVAGAALARRLVSRAPRGTVLLGGVLGAPLAPSGDDGRGLLALLKLADSLGVPVDLHVDESGDGGGAAVALVAKLARQHRIGVPITCSHSCSMSQLSPPRLSRLAEAMAEAALTVVALPPTNLWLLGHRGEDTPARRPMAPIRQLQRAGVTVAVGGDNVQDPWHPGGDFDPLELLRFSLPAAHLAPWQRQGLAPFTTAASRLMGLEWDGVLRPGSPADLVVLAAGSWSDLLARSPQRRVLRAGHWLPAPAPPELATLLEKLAPASASGAE